LHLVHSTRSTVGLALDVVKYEMGSRHRIAALPIWNPRVISCTFLYPQCSDSGLKIGRRAYRRFVAISGPSAMQQNANYSITSSAMACSVNGVEVRGGRRLSAVGV
jgi:hypothetical protein